MVPRPAHDADPKRVALIGYGLAGSVFHAPLIAATAGLRLTTIVTSDAERRAQARRDFPDARIVARAEELWSGAGDLDLVVVATPNRTHAPLARAAIEAGIAVAVDKPFATSAAEGRAIAAEARRRGVLLTVFQNRRWDGDFLTVQRLVRQGALGTPIVLESSFERWRPEPRGGWKDRADPGDATGVLFDLGSHLIDQALVLLGPVRTVYAELRCVRAGSAVVDDAFVALVHAAGARSHLHASLVTAQPGPRFRVLGTAGAYVKHGLDPQEERLRAGARPSSGWGEEPPDRWGAVGAGERVERVATEPGAYPAFYGMLATAIRSGGPLPVDPADSITGLEIIGAAMRSSAEQRVIEIQG